MEDNKTAIIAGAAVALVIAAVAFFTSDDSDDTRDSEPTLEEQIEEELRCIEVAEQKMQERIAAGEYKGKTITDLMSDFKFEEIAAHYE